MLRLGVRVPKKELRSGVTRILAVVGLSIALMSSGWAQMNEVCGAVGQIKGYS
jgi:hypothetical protein